MKNSLFIICAALFVFACGDQKIDTSKAKAEMEAREIKKVSEAQILEEAMKLGRKISADFHLSARPDAKSETYIFNISYGPDSLFEKDHYFFDDPRDLEGKALQVFEAYLYNSNHGIRSEENLQSLESDRTLLYTKPMLANDTTEVGMWAIKIPKKTVVLNIKN